MGGLEGGHGNKMMKAYGGGRTHQLHDSWLIGLLPVRRRMQLPIVSLPRQQKLVSWSFSRRSIYGYWVYIPDADA